MNIGETHKEIIRELGGLKLTLPLMRTIGLPPDGKYMAAGAIRLAKLIELFPKVFPEELITNGVTSFSIRAWEKEAGTILKSSTNIMLAESIYASPTDDLICQKRSSNSPLYGKWLTYYPGFSGLITTRGQADPLCLAFDTISSITLGLIIKKHYLINNEQYLEYSGKCEYVFNYNSNKNNSCKLKYPPLPHMEMNRLQRASLGIRTLQQVIHTDQLFEEVIGVTEIAELWELLDIYRHSLPKNQSGDILFKRIEGLMSFLVDDYIRQRIPNGNNINNKYIKIDNKNFGVNSQKKGDIYWDDLLNEMQLGTYLEAPEFVIPLEEQERDKIEPNLQEIEDARLNGVSPLELIEPGPTVDSIDFDEQDDESTLQAWSENKAEMRRRIAEYQPYSIDRVNPDILVDVVDHLYDTISRSIQISPPKVDRDSIASIVILCSILLGYSINKVAQELSINEIISDELFTKNPENDRIHYDLITGSFVVAVNQHRSEKNISTSARQVALWIRLPDVLGLQNAMKWLNTFRLPPEIIYAAAKESEVKLISKFGVSLKKLRLAFPLASIDVTGEFSTAALISAWDEENSDVNLHYLAPRASIVIENYYSVMKEMLEHTKSFIPLNESNAVTQQGFIGAPLCPDESIIKNLVESIKNTEIQLLDINKAHNFITLSTILLTSLSIGLRHAIDVDIHGMELESSDIAYYQEKGKARLLVLPLRLGLQLRAYDRHIEKMNIDTYKDKKSNSNLFYLLTKSGDKIEFHPTKISEYLLEFGINFPFDPNVLRRYIFTVLFEERRWGPEIDHFIGHATEGRRPLTPLSGISLGKGLSAISKSVDKVLEKLDWPVVEIPDYAY